MTSNGQALKRKVPDDDTVYVSFTIRGLDGLQSFFKVKQESMLIKVFREYCQRMNMEYDTTHFLYTGKHVRGERESPKMLNMENGDEITVVTHQYGGGALKF